MEKLGRVFVILIVIAVALGCGWLNLQVEKEMSKNTAQALDVIGKEADAIGAQSRAIEEQARTIGKQSDHIVEQSETQRKALENQMATNKLLTVLLIGAVGFIVLIMILAKGNRRVANG